MERHAILVITAIYNSEGSPEFVATLPRVSKADYDEGEHFLMAQKMLGEEDYETEFGHYVHFDEYEAPKELVDAFKGGALYGATYAQWRKAVKGRVPDFFSN